MRDVLEALLLVIGCLVVVSLMALALHDFLLWVLQ